VQLNSCPKLADNRIKILYSCRLVSDIARHRVLEIAFVVDVVPINNRYTRCLFGFSVSVKSMDPKFPTDERRA